MAVSGGPDSVFMLYALLDLKDEFHIDICVLHFNHKLREASSEEEEFVRLLSERLKLSFYCGSADVSAISEGQGLSIEDAARKARYAFFERCKRELSLDSVALAHTKDDLTETMLINLIRGSSLKGLVSMKPRRDFYIRPVMGLRKREIEEFLKNKGFRFVVDESNMNRDFLRNRVRLELIKHLEEFNPSIVETLYKTFQALKADEELLDELVELEMVRRVKFFDRKAILDLKGLSLSLRRRLISEACKRLLGTHYSLSFDNIERLNALKKGKQVGLRGLLKAHIENGYLVIEKL